MARILIIGDDLTGTNATAAIYARRGLTAVTALSPDLARDLSDSVDVLAFTTNSRNFTPAAASAAVRDAMALCTPNVELMVKRMDTTLRGNVGAEISACIERFREIHPNRLSFGLVVPAYPASGRCTVGGYQLVNGLPLLLSPAATDPLAPVHHSSVAEIISEQCDMKTVSISLDAVLERPRELENSLLRGIESNDLVIVDSVSNENQRNIAAAAHQVSRRAGFSWIVFDSGPFGAEYAAELGISGTRTSESLIFVVIGSLTEQTGRQADLLESELGADLIPISTYDESVSKICSRIDSDIATGVTVVGIRTTLGSDPHPPQDRVVKMLAFLGEFARTCCEKHDFSGIYASGGDVAVEVLAALGAKGYQIENEVLPLAVSGHIVGGSHDGIGFATKGGLIGGPNAAVQCVQALRSRRGTPTLFITPS